MYVTPNSLYLLLGLPSDLFPSDFQVEYISDHHTVASSTSQRVQYLVYKLAFQPKVVFAVPQQNVVYLSKLLQREVCVSVYML